MSVIEGNAAPILDRVVAEARRGQASTFSERDHKALSAFFVAQFSRSPDLHSIVAGRSYVEAAVAEIVAEWEAAGHARPGDQRAAAESERLTKMEYGDLSLMLKSARVVSNLDGDGCGQSHLPDRLDPRIEGGPLAGRHTSLSGPATSSSVTATAPPRTTWALTAPM